MKVMNIFCLILKIQFFLRYSKDLYNTQPSLFGLDLVLT